MKVFDARASIILFNILKTKQFEGTFLLPNNICPIVPAVFLKSGVKFEFVDIDLESLCMDQDIAIDKIRNNPDIVGVLFVHTFGTDIECESFFKILKAMGREVFIIDDRCLMPPDFDYGIDESYADMALFSTGYSKYIDIGWGGFSFIKDEHSYVPVDLPFKQEDLVEFTNEMHGCIKKHRRLDYKDSDWLGTTEHLFHNFDEYKSVIETKLESMGIHKELLNSIYKTHLCSRLFLGEQFNGWRFSIVVDRKEDLLNRISSEGLFASSHYCDIEFMFKKEYSKSSNSRKVHSKIINLFNDFRFSAEQARKVVSIVNEHVGLSI